MTKEELRRLISGPISAYLMDDGCSYGKFIELLNREFPELDINYSELYPLLFNITVKEKEYVDTCFDINSTGKKYLNSNYKTIAEYIKYNDAKFAEYIKNNNLQQIFE